MAKVKAEYLVRLQLKIDQIQAKLDEQTEPSRITEATTKLNALLQKKADVEAS